MSESEKVPKKQEAKTPSRRHMTALWVAIATALGSQGIPKIVELLENKPDTTQVQTMIAKQTRALTEAQHQMADAVKELDVQFQAFERERGEHRTLTGQLEGRTELLRDVMRGCCTRRVAQRLNEPEALQPKPEPMAVSESSENSILDGLNPLVKGIPEGAKNAASKIYKVPQFDVEQQLQTQDPVEE